MTLARTNGSEYRCSRAEAHARNGACNAGPDAGEMKWERLRLRSITRHTS